MTVRGAADDAPVRVEAAASEMVSALMAERLKASQVSTGRPGADD